MEYSDNEITQYVEKYFSDISGKLKQEQKDIIRNILSGRDVMAILPTGFGKSVCFQLPAVMMKGITLVISPLVSLMQDQVEELKERNIPALCLSKGEETSKKEMFSAIVAGKYKLIYTAPERLKREDFIRLVKQLDISMIAVDEAHCVSMWGYDFRPDYLTISKFIRKLPKRPVIAAFTATATKFLQEDVIKALQLKKPYAPETKYARENLTFNVQICGDKASKTKRMYQFLEEHKDECGIIFCATVETVNNLCQDLQEKGYTVTKYHGQLRKKTRDANQRFFKKREKGIMVATNAYGMGINKKNVRYVLHYNVPASIENYYQEAGRAGRDRKPARSRLLFLEDDVAVHEQMIKMQKEESVFPEEIAEFRYQLARKRLTYMKEYCYCTKKKKGEKTFPEQDSQKLQKYIQEYFFGRDFQEEQDETQQKGILYTQQKLEEQYHLLEEHLQKKNILFVNRTKVASVLRNGTYPWGEEYEVVVGSPKAEWRRTVICQLKGERLNYFDMMVADAVFTLEVLEEKRIYVKNIAQLLSGDLNISLQKSKKEAIANSIEKMRNIEIVIDRSRSMDLGISYGEEEKLKKIQGKFLPLERIGDYGYAYQELPPLYYYAQMTQHIEMFRTEHLVVETGENKKMPDSIENLMLKFYLLYRVEMMKNNKALTRAKKVQEKPVLAHTIRFEQEDNRRKGMYEILGMEEDSNYFQKVKRISIESKIEQILSSFCQKGLIKGFSWINDDGRKTGVELYYRLERAREEEE